MEAYNDKKGKKFPKIRKIFPLISLTDGLHKASPSISIIESSLRNSSYVVIKVAGVS